MIIGIIAISRNYAIGRDGNLPWHYSADLKFFKRTTTGQTVVMGFNTWRSIGRPLPNRLNIVLSSARSIEAQPALRLMRSKEEVIRFAESADGDVYVIGGAQIYGEFADVIERWIVTEIPESIPDADAFIGEDFLNGFECEFTEEIGDGLIASTYRRLKNGV